MRPFQRLESGPNSGAISGYLLISAALSWIFYGSSLLLSPIDPDLLNLPALNLQGGEIAPCQPHSTATTGWKRGSIYADTQANYITDCITPFGPATPRLQPCCSA